MEPLFLEVTVRATSIAAGTALLLWAARIRTPAILHGVWVGVLVAMLVLPAWTLWGPEASVPVLPEQERRVDAVTARPLPIAASSGPRIAAATPPVNPPAAPHGDDVSNWRNVALGVYLLVTVALLVRLVSGTLAARQLLRRSVVRAGRLTSAACASPVTVGWLRPVVVLPEGWWEWPAAKLDAVLAHEQEHVRRRHPCVQWLALLNRAFFWFHPVAWWLERRLTALAEHACDDAVLARGHAAEDYSEYLLEIAHHAGGRGRVNLAGVFMAGVCLPQRIRRICDGSPMARVSRLRLWCVSAACAIAAAAGVVATPARADSQSPRDVARMVVRPLQPRWIAPDSALPQPVSLEWLEGDEWAFQVQPIITDEELVAYSRLTGPEQRNAFLASFWAERDPTPGTTENEFQEEYVRRVQYANEHFGGASARAGFGFETDRGRMYLMFGAPDAIDAEGAAADPYETWRYASVSGIGADFRVRFSLARDLYCGYRILSPAPLTTIEAAGTARPGSEPHAVVQIYPLGLTAVSVPLDATRVVGAAYEILDRDGAQVDRGQIGSIESDAAAEPLSQHLSPGWLATGLGCTHALPAGRYTLSTAVRFATGEMQREAVTFDVS